MTNVPDPETPASAATPQYEPGGGKLLAVAFTLVGLALAGMAWSFFSRQNAPQDAPVIKGRFLPPSERKDVPPAVAPPPTFSPATVGSPPQK
jgi:hypothetical protein